MPATSFNLSSFMSTSILVAHGDEGLAGFFRRHYLDFDYQVETATSELECLRQLQLLQPDILILDQKLAANSVDGLSRLRNECRLQNVRVILICESGAVIPADLLGPPIYFFVRTPFRLTALLECIRAATASSTQNRLSLRRPSKSMAGELVISSVADIL